MNCHDMKMDNVYECESCGLQIKVVKPCNCESCDACAPDEFDCCGKRLTPAA